MVHIKRHYTSLILFFSSLPIIIATTYAQKALKLNELSPDSHKWYAITLGSRGEFLKINEKIQNGYVFKEHIDRAIILNPNDASLHHLVGRFCFEVIDQHKYK